MQKDFALTKGATSSGCAGTHRLSDEQDDWPTNRRGRQHSHYSFRWVWYTKGSYTCIVQTTDVSCLVTITYTLYLCSREETTKVRWLWRVSWDWGLWPFAWRSLSFLVLGGKNSAASIENVSPIILNKHGDMLTSGQVIIAACLSLCTNQCLLHILLGVNLIKARQKFKGKALTHLLSTSQLSTGSLMSPAPSALLNKASAQGFALNGQFITPPGVSLPAVPLEALQQIKESNKWPQDFNKFLVLSSLFTIYLYTVLTLFMMM